MKVSKRQQSLGVAGYLMFNVGLSFINWDTCDCVKVVFTFLKHHFWSFRVILHLLQQISVSFGFC